MTLMPAVVHDVLAASVPPVKVIVLGAVVPSVPAQVAVEPVATVRPAGSVSLKATPVSPAELGLVSVKVSVLLPPSVTGLVAKDLVIVGGTGTAQPLKVTLSALRSAPLEGVLAP